jgi:hypothetical protein
MINKSEVVYLEDALIIKIPTYSPGATHALLLQGLITSLKNYLLIEERISGDIDGLVALANVLQNIAPTEIQLQTGFEIRESPAA